MKKVGILILTMVLMALVALGCDDVGENVGETNVTMGQAFKVIYYEGEELDVSGGKLTVKIGETSTNVDITKDMVTGFDSQTAGEKDLTVTHTISDTKYTVAVKINVIALQSVKVTKQPDKTVYYLGDVFDAEGMELTAVYANKVEKSVDGFTTLDTALKLSDTKSTVTYRGKTADVAISVIASPFTNTDTGISFADGNNQLQFVQLDAYNHSVPISLNGVKTLSLKADVSEAQIAAEAVLSYIVYTNDGTKKYMLDFDQTLELAVAEHNGLNTIAAFIECNDWQLTKTTTMDFVNYDEGEVFDGTKFEGVYSSADMSIVIRKSIGDKYEVLLPNASEDVKLGGTCYRQTWTEFNADRVSYVYDNEYKLTATKVNLHASTSISFVFDSVAQSFTASMDGKYKTSSGLTTVFNKGTVFTKVKHATHLAENETKLNEALAAAKDGDTILLRGDINLTKQVLIEKNITLDGSGYTLNGKTITATQNSEKHIIAVLGAKATIQNITLRDSDRSGVNVFGGGANLVNVMIRDCRLNGVVVNSSNIFMDNVRIGGNRDGAVDLSPKYTTASITVTDSCKLESDYQILQMDYTFKATVNVPDSYELVELEVAEGVSIKHWAKVVE